MKKKILIPVVVIGIVIVVSIMLIDNKTIEKDDVVFHITLADSRMYNDDGVYVENIFLEKGSYEFRFIPNGDSPRILDISLNGEQFGFSNEFVLEGVLHETGISEYYTWDYSGTKRFDLDSKQEITISIDPNGNLSGPVSVDILRNE